MVFENITYKHSKMLKTKEKSKEKHSYNISQRFTFDFNKLQKIIPKALKNKIFKKRYESTRVNILKTGLLEKLTFKTYLRLG